MTKKTINIGLLSLTGIIFTLSSAVAGGIASVTAPPAKKARIGLGVNYAGDAWGAIIRYNAQQFYAGLAGNYSYNEVYQGSEYSLYELQGEIGLHNQIHHTPIDVVYGMSASYAWYSKIPAGQTNSYGIGPFVGLEILLKNHYRLSFSILPLAYLYEPNKNKVWGVFKEGDFSVTYVF